MTDHHEGMLTELVRGFGDWFRDEQALARAAMTRELYPYTALFSPIVVNSVKLKNRIVMGPMGNINMAEEMGRPAERMIRYFADRARGGVGLITSGLVPVSQGIDPSTTEPGDRSYFPRIDGSRTVRDGWRTLAEALHAFGTHFFIQLTPGLGRVGSPECLVTKHRLPVSASWNPNFYHASTPVPAPDRRRVPPHRFSHGAGRRGCPVAADRRRLPPRPRRLSVGTDDKPGLQSAQNGPLCRLADVSAWRSCARSAPAPATATRSCTASTSSLALNATYGERMEQVGSLRKFRERAHGGDDPRLTWPTWCAAGVDMFDVDLGCYDNWWLPHPPTSDAAGLLPGRRQDRQGLPRGKQHPLQRRAAGAGGCRRQAGLSGPGRARPARRRLRHGHAGPAAARRPGVAATRPTPDASPRSCRASATRRAA